MSELTLEEHLQEALKNAATSKKALNDAIAKLKPLEDSYNADANHVRALMAKYQGVEGHGAPAKKRKDSGKPRNISNESKLSRVSKAAYTRAINSGHSEKEAKAMSKSAEASLKAKLGVA